MLNLFCLHSDRRFWWIVSFSSTRTSATTLQKYIIKLSWRIYIFKGTDYIRERKENLFYCKSWCTTRMWWNLRKKDEQSSSLNVAKRSGFWELLTSGQKLRRNLLLFNLSYIMIVLTFLRYDILPFKISYMKQKNDRNSKVKNKFTVQYICTVLHKS